MFLSDEDKIFSLGFYSVVNQAQSAGVVEYRVCISAKG